MTALSAGQRVKHEDGNYGEFPVSASTTIYQGSMVCVDTDGYLVPAADTASYVCVGVAEEDYDNSSGSDGDKVARVWRRRKVKITASSAAQTWVRQLVYVVDDATVGLYATPTNKVVAGRCVKYDSSTEVWVDFCDQVLDGVTSSAAELNIMDGVTSTTAELNILDGVTSTASELNILDGVTSTTAELNILDGVTATATELNVLDQSANAALMTPGTGLSSATGFVYDMGIQRSGNIIVTRIYMDLTGLNSGGVAGDIIGKDGGTANCHFGQVTAANNGTIYAGWIDVGEAPAGGDPDIDLFSGDESTGAENAAASGLTNSTQLCNSGDLAVGTRVNLTAFPAADQYLYMVVGTQTDADYTAGMIIVTLVGVDLT